MFQFFKKNMPRTNSYQSYNPEYNLNNYNNYDLSLLQTRISELNRLINDLYKRINTLENYLGISSNRQDF